MKNIFKMSRLRTLLIHNGPSWCINKYKVTFLKSPKVVNDNNEWTRDHQQYISYLLP